MKPYGLVLAGGGAKGAYQLGAWKAMRELGISFEVVAGASIGSINGAFVASNDYSSAAEFWKNASLDKGVNLSSALPDSENFFSKKNWGVLFKEFLKNGGFDASPVENFLSEFIDENKVRNGIPLGIVTIDYTQKVTPLELFTESIPQGHLIDYLLASSNIPFANNIGPDGQKFLDGGAYDNTPISFLRKNGYNRLVVVDIATIKGVSHSFDITNSETVYIRPYNIEDLGASFDFDSKLMEKRIEMGYLDTMKAFSHYLGKIYYFEVDVFRSMVKKYGAKAVSELEELAYKLKLPTVKVYSEDEFITELKVLYDQSEAEKDSEEKRTEPETENAEEVSDEAEGLGAVYSSIKKVLKKIKPGDEETEPEKDGEEKQIEPEAEIAEEVSDEAEGLGAVYSSIKKVLKKIKSSDGEYAEAKAILKEIK